MKERKYLTKKILLRRESDGVAGKRTFYIVKRLNEGASAVCYEAYPEDSGRGVLKEFYPQDAYVLERNEDGQLVSSEEFREAYYRFKKAEDNYIEPYKMLLKFRQENFNQDLATFIPAFEIYHGCDSDGKVIGTTYIWTPEPKLETFDTICSMVHKNPGDNPEHKLVIILKAIETLIKCICSLHMACMIHRDIKPSNFGFIKRGDETLTQTLSMFDINSVCSVYGETKGVVGTEGFMEPEAGYKEANNQTDIYSIGATLFNAIIVTDEVKAGNYLYKRKYYDRLGEMVNESKLFQASESNAYPRLQNILTKILKKCLCERENRYENCEELLKDMQEALFYALPSEYAKKSRSGEQWSLVDVEKLLDLNKKKNSFLAIQYHLYAHPLYQCCPDTEESLNVLLIGFGGYGQKFLDVCLQNGQIRNKKLCVTVVSDDEDDWNKYLKHRPELPEFFNINGSLTGDRDSYGDILFKLARLKCDDQSAMTKVVRGIVSEHCERKPLHYIFVALLGDDELNAAAANACRTAVNVLKMDCAVSCIFESSPRSDKANDVFYPLYVNENIKKSPFYHEIERMAFNMHLVWEKNLNVDYKAVKGDFKKTYNHDSCVSSVLALKYKLYSMGIDLENCSFEEAARLFKEMIENKNNYVIINELIWVEHRRWVAEKLCLGWCGIRDVEECAGGVTKDEKNKRHLCILKSRPEQKLAEKEWSDTNHEMWDTAVAEELDKLDELDRMSVELHRMFVKRANAVKKENLLFGSSIESIRTLIEGNKEAIVTFQEWFTCTKDIANGDVRKVRLYKSLKTSFLNAVNELSIEKKKSVCEQVKAFEAIFYPVLASMEYRDWKQDDVNFIDNIPFVLTYTENAYLVIPFKTGDNSERFKNVAAATIVSPARILYLYSVERKQDIKNLMDSIKSVIVYMQKKNFKAGVEFVITVSMDSVGNDNIEQEIMDIGRGRIRRVKRINLNGSKTAAQALREYLKRKRFIAVEKNDSEVSRLLLNDGFYNSFPNYEFDSTDMKFNKLSKCEMLGYIRKSPYIAATDMAAFCLSSGKSINHPEFFEDYEELWEKYMENNALWKTLCNLLGHYSEKNNILASFEKKSKKQNLDELHYIVPSVCNKSIAKIISFLKDHNIAEQGSRINGYTTDSCEVVIMDRCGYRDTYDRLFADVYVLMQSDFIKLSFNTISNEANIIFENLMVKNAQIPADRREEICDLMKYFKEKRYVINLSVSFDGKMSFTYASRQIKELLSNEGKIIEAYTYHKVKEFGKFDDVVSYFEIDREGCDARSEVDCILTKGFRTLFIECTPCLKLDSEDYLKTARLTEQFGINASAVLIAPNIQETDYNEQQISRGRELNVETVWKSDEINNLGQTLLKLINGN